MCGIAGIFGYADSAPPVDRDELLRIREAMINRGPDGAGLWISPDRRVGLAHRRLAIIDLSETGAQPMATDDGHFRITFNGEIYNYRELRRELERKGFRFRSTSDTEVLLHLYADRGAEMVHALRGMYAFAIWDERKRGLFLGRDPFGIKPLYYADDGSTIRVASQVKALLKGGAIDTTVEPAGHVGFFLWGHVPEPYTLYKNIRALPAGTSLWIDAAGRKDVRQFFSLTSELARASAMTLSITRNEVHERMRAALLDSVAHHMVSDVPIGVFLSSGIDSTTVTALAKEVGDSSLNTITLGFREYRGTEQDETPLAEVVARLYGTLHRTSWVERKDFDNERQRILDVMDQPTTDGVNSYFVSKVAHDAGLKVALSGLGGDELFGGYPSFAQIPPLVNALKLFEGIPSVGKGFRYLSAPILKHLTSPKYAGILEYGGTYGGAYLLRRGMFMPWELPSLLDGEMVRQGWEELHTLSRLEQTTRGVGNTHLKVAALETAWYMRNQLLRDTDWASMAHSVEVRVPLVDIELFRAIAPLFTLPRAPERMAIGLTPLKPLPIQVTQRNKTGFLIPVQAWLVGQEESLPRERGIRGWARYVYNASAKQPTARVLALVTDAYGGRGGIALYNRNLLQALCEHSAVKEVKVFPRGITYAIEETPRNLHYEIGAARNKLTYALSCFTSLISNRRANLIVCGHLHLLPLAFFLKWFLRCPVVTVIYGVDAWTPTRHMLANYLCRRLDALISIRKFTTRKFMSWSGAGNIRSYYLPNCYDEEKYGIAPKNAELLKKYGIEGKKVILTAGRLDEQRKGFDEILEVLPILRQKIRNVAYLVLGDGKDRGRLEEKAEQLGVIDMVKFTGFVPEAEKANHYRLADVFAMPGSDADFDTYPYRFVFLEALACGVPVVGCRFEDEYEASDPVATKLIIQVDPRNKQEIIDGILTAISNSRRVPLELRELTYRSFSIKLHRILDDLLKIHGNI